MSRTSTYSTSIQDFLLIFIDRDLVDFLPRQTNMQLAAIHHQSMKTAYAMLPAHIRTLSNSEGFFSRD